METLHLPALATKRFGRPTFHYEEAESTQDLMKEIATASTDGTAVLADHQTHGRGRQGRHWFSLPPPQIYLSVLLKPPLPVAQLPIFSIMGGIALANTFENIGVREVQIKWPNDVFVHGKKISGILAEAQPPHVILGMGINVSGSRTDFPHDLADHATTVEMASGPVDRFEFLTELLANLEIWTDRLYAGRVTQLQGEFSRYWLYQDRKFRVKISDEIHCGTSKQIDSDGALLMQTERGKALRIVSGEILPPSESNH